MCKGHLFRIEEIGNWVQTSTGKYTQKAHIDCTWEEVIKEASKNPKFYMKYRVTQVPCGVCLECRLKDSQQWAFRMMKENKYHKSSWMITCTYDDENIPKYFKINAKTGELEQTSLTLWKEHHQKFIRAIRDKFPSQKLKFRLCGEYGSENVYKDNHGTERIGTKRPHFHIIIFGLELPDLKFHRWSYCEWDKKQKNALFKSKILNKLWGKGWVDVNEVNYETCAYVSRYIMKKQKGAKGKEYYEQENKLPEYQECSKGIGKQYFYDNIDKFLNDEKHFISTKNGVKEVGAIRYYDKLLEKEYPEQWEEIKKKRREKSQEIMAKILAETNISEHEYVENRARKAEKRAKKLIRPLV